MKVSIGLPIYNCESTVKLTVQSIFAQTYQDWELIIVDDGSKDRSLEIVRRIEDRRVRILADGKNRQLSYRLNQLAEMSQGQFIARMDADDLMHPERLQRQVSYFNHHPTCHILGTSIYLINHLSEICGQASTWQSLPAGVNFIQQSLYFHPRLWQKRNGIVQINMMGNTFGQRIWNSGAEP